MRLDVVSDLESETEYEILFGNTNRNAFSEYYTGSLSPDPLCGLIKAVGNKLLVVGCDDEATVTSVTRFIKSYTVNYKYTPIFNFERDIDERFVVYLDDPDSVLTSGADLRVMSYNILGESSDTYPKFTERQTEVFSTIRNYMPDVVGLQESNEAVWKLLDENFGNMYEFAGQKNSLGEWSSTGMMWNVETVRLLDSGHMVYSVGTTRFRSSIWGLFQHLETGEQFLFVNTHWGFIAEERAIDAAEMLAQVKSLQEKYHLPLVTVGDYNATDTLPYLKEYLEVTGQSITKDCAERVVLGIPSKDVIDHVNIDSGFGALLCKQVNNEITTKASDHFPVFVDLYFK